MATQNALLAPELPALAKGKSADDQHITNDISEFLSRYTPEVLSRPRDILEGRYTIDLSKPLAELNTKNARAFVAADELERDRTVYALVCATGTVQRQRVLEILKEVEHPNILQVYAYGVVALSQPDAERFVIFQERPTGKKLSDLVKSTVNPLNEQFIIRHLIAPIGSALMKLAELGITHGGIRSDNIFYGDHVMVGDFTSEPCGYAQPYYFEPVERMQAAFSARGEGTISNDYYSLAVLALFLLYGEKHFEGWTQETLIRNILRQGPYTTLLRNQEPTDVLTDFLRGVLTNHPNDRWNARHLKSWLEGKRLNVMMPPSPAEALRPFEFNGQQAHSRRELAHFFFSDWANFLLVMQTDQLSQWISVSLRNKELSEAIKRIKQTIAATNPKHDIQISEQLMRVILLLDSIGPIRINNLAFHIDGMDGLAAELFNNKSQNELRLLAKFIEQSMGHHWVDMQHTGPGYVMPEAVNTIILRLDRLRLFIRSTSWGFGLERMQYELNPETPCMSSLFSSRHISTLPDLLSQLDRLAPKLARDQTALDPHIAAFIAHKLGIIHDVKLHELASYPSLASDNNMIALKFMALAQQRSDSGTLPGLAHWLALRVIPALEVLRSKTLRSKVKAVLLSHAKSGSINLMAEVITNSNYALADNAGFRRAVITFQENNEHMVMYRKESTIDQYSQRLGGFIAKFFGYAIFAIIAYKVGLGL
jgi:hypothetical protein